LLISFFSPQTFALQLIAFIAEGNWPSDTRSVAVRILADMASLADGALVTKELASSVVLQLCVHAITGLKKEKTLDDLLAEIVSCISRWCLSGRWLLQAENVLRKMIALVDQSIATRPSKTAVRREEKKKRLNKTSLTRNRMPRTRCCWRCCSTSTTGRPPPAPTRSLPSTRRPTLRI
jgi:hypothetical protein